MKDISSFSDGDLVLLDTQTAKAANVFQVQIGDLEYSPEFGIDIAFFINPDLQFQNESFKSYLVQRLSENHVNVNQVTEVLEKLYLQYGFVVGDSETNTGGFIK